MALKAQAAIFDGITFLLLTTLSASLIYSAVNTYGQQEDQVMRSAYTINYLQTVSKSFYHVDVQQLAGVCNDKDKCTLEIYKDLKEPGGCATLTEYLPGISLSDLLKKDLADPSTAKLNNKYGDIPAPGKKAMRCASKEFMKPFASAGYKYVIEIINGGKGTLIPMTTPLITNLDKNSEYINAIDGLVTKSVCENALNGNEKIFSVASPFKVTYKEINSDTATERQLILRICMWPSRPNSS